MAGIRSLQRRRRKTRHRNEPHPPVVHLYFFSYPWFPAYYLHDPGFLDEYPELYAAESQESALVAVEAFT